MSLQDERDLDKETDKRQQWEDRGKDWKLPISKATRICKVATLEVARFYPLQF